MISHDLSNPATDFAGVPYSYSPLLPKSDGLFYGLVFSDRDAERKVALQCSCFEGFHGSRRIRSAAAWRTKKRVPESMPRPKALPQARVDTWENAPVWARLLFVNTGLGEPDLKTTTENVEGFRSGVV